MAEPISLFHVRDHSRDLAFSALPHAPVRTGRGRRRPVTVFLRRLRSHHGR